MARSPGALDMARRALLSSTARRLNTTYHLPVERLQAVTTRRRQKCCLHATRVRSESSRRLANERSLATGGRAIEIEPVIFIAARRSDREIAVGPPVRCGEDFLEDLSRLSVNRPILPSLSGDFTGITGVEDKGAFHGQAIAAVPP